MRAKTKFRILDSGANEIFLRTLRALRERINFHAKLAEIAKKNSKQTFFPDSKFRSDRKTFLIPS
jgi:hypothetical protein